MKKALYCLMVMTLSFALQTGMARADQCLEGGICAGESGPCTDFGVLNICECEPLNANDIVIYFEEAVDQKLLKGFVSRAYKRTNSKKAIQKGKKQAVREMRAMLETAASLEANFSAATCAILEAALDRCDGDRGIQDFVKGPARDGLACRIGIAMDNICPVAAPPD